MNPRPSAVRTTVKRTRRPSAWRWLSVFGRRRLSPAALVVVLIGGLFLFNFVNQVIRQAQLEQLREEVRADVARLTAENRDLRQSVLYYESNDYAELVAREQLGYARIGDTVIMPTYPDRVISDATTLTQPAVVSDTVPIDTTALTTEPNWVRWWRMLSGAP